MNTTNTEGNEMTAEQHIQKARDAIALFPKGPCGRELALALTKLDEARLWLREAGEISKRGAQ
jgi:hypothetical protein